MPRVSDRARPARVPPDTKIASCCLSVGEQGLGSPGGGREMSTLAHQSGSKLLELETKFREVFRHYAKKDLVADAKVIRDGQL